MDLKSIQAIIELVQKKPLVSLLCLGCLMILIFSPLILAMEKIVSQGQVTALPAGQSSTPAENIIHQGLDAKALAHAMTVFKQLQAGKQSAVTVHPIVASMAVPALNTPPTALPNSVAAGLPEQYYIVVASSADKPSAIKALSLYSNHFPAEIYQTQNGWYAVTIGRYAKADAKRILAEGTLSQSIPKGSWLSPGKSWLGKVYP
jgi:hypothetical protein